MGLSYLWILPPPPKTGYYIVISQKHRVIPCFFAKNQKKSKRLEISNKFVFFAKKSERLKISYKFAFILPFPPRNSSIRPQAATASYSTAKQPLGFHNFSRTPNPRFFGRIDEFLVAVAAFLGSPNPYPSPPSPPKLFEQQKINFITDFQSFLFLPKNTVLHGILRNHGLISRLGGGVKF